LRSFDFAESRAGEELGTVHANERIAIFVVCGAEVDEEESSFTD
jgi:hypothetical protein